MPKFKCRCGRKFTEADFAPGQAMVCPDCHRRLNVDPERLAEKVARRKEEKRHRAGDRKSDPPALPGPDRGVGTADPRGPLSPPAAPPHPAPPDFPETQADLGPAPGHVKNAPAGPPPVPAAPPSAQGTLSNEVTLRDRGADLDPGQDDFDLASVEIVDLAVRYQIQGTLGQGGMGQVLRAEDRRLKRAVAIKRLKPEVVGSRRMLSRFLTEAQAVAQLNHYNIVQVYDYGRTAEGPFLVLELVDGPSLADRLRSGPLPLDQAVDLVGQVCDALSLAHRKGIVHRDIKPANILLTPSGEPKLTDFGVARQAALDHAQTQAGAVLGTLDYMAPEQRADARAADPRSDQWSLAATLYQMVTGELPRVIDLNLVPPAVREPLRLALKSRPEERFASVAEFQEALHQAAHAQPAQSAGGGLRQQELETLQRQIDAARREFRFAECRRLLSAMTALDDPRLASFRTWGHERLLLVEHDQRQAEQLRDRLLFQARQSFDRAQFDEAVKLISQIPPALRDATVEDLHIRAGQKLSEARASRSRAPREAVLIPETAFLAPKPAGHFASPVVEPPQKRPSEYRGGPNPPAKSEPLMRAPPPVPPVPLESPSRIAPPPVPPGSTSRELPALKPAPAPAPLPIPPAPAPARAARGCFALLFAGGLLAAGTSGIVAWQRGWFARPEPPRTAETTTFIDHYDAAKSSPRMQGNLRDSRRVGLWQAWHPNGTIWVKGDFGDGQPAGTWEYFDEAGSPCGTRTNGRKTGRWREWNASRTVQAEGVYEQDQPDGEWTFRHASEPFLVVTYSRGAILSAVLRHTERGVEVEYRRNPRTRRFEGAVVQGSLSDGGSKPWPVRYSADDTAVPELAARLRQLDAPLLERFQWEPVVGPFDPGTAPATSQVGPEELVRSTPVPDLRALETIRSESMADAEADLEKRTQQEVQRRTSAMRLAEWELQLRDLEARETALRARLGPNPPSANSLKSEQQRKEQELASLDQTLKDSEKTIRTRQRDLDKLCKGKTPAELRDSLNKSIKYTRDAVASGMLPSVNVATGQLTKRKIVNDADRAQASAMVDTLESMLVSLTLLEQAILKENSTVTRTTEQRALVMERIAELKTKVADAEDLEKCEAELADVRRRIAELK